MFSKKIRNILNINNYKIANEKIRKIQFIHLYLNCEITISYKIYLDFVMKIHPLYVKSAVSLIDLAIDGLNRIKELAISNKEITDNDLMRSAAPLNELSNIIDKQNIELSYPTCSQCVYYSSGIMSCMHPASVGRIIDDAENMSCDNISLKFDEEENYDEN